MEKPYFSMCHCSDNTSLQYCCFLLLGIPDCLYFTVASYLNVTLKRRFNNTDPQFDNYVRAIPFENGEGYKILPNFETSIRKMTFVETPIQIFAFSRPLYTKNCIFETPIQKITFLRPPYKKLHF